MAAQLNYYEEVAKRKLAALPTWSSFKFESRDKGVYLTGAESSGMRTRGKRKGRPRWDGKRTSVFVSDDEAKAEAAAYSAKTGNCYVCRGSAQEWCGWNHETGNRYQPCTKCRATGKMDIV